MSEAVFLLLFTTSCSIMACMRTSLPLPLLSDNLSDVSPIAVTSPCQCRRWFQSAEGCHNIKTLTDGFRQSETGKVLAT